MILEAIMAINPNARARVIDDDIEQIEWLSGTTPISKSDILAKEAELKAKKEAEAKPKKATPVKKVPRKRAPKKTTKKS